MSDAGRSQKSAEIGLDLTRTIRKLSMPDLAANDELREVGGTAVLFSSNSSATKWAPRWLNQYDVKTTVISEAANAISFIRATQPEVLIVDAAMLTETGVPLYREIMDARDLQIPVFVMCSSSREASAALEHEPYDLIRKPFEWALISRRVKYAVYARNLRKNFEDGQASLREALVVADAARQRLRQGESTEPVTGLPNRKKFAELVKRSMAAVDRDGSALAVIVVGFNRFRLVIEAMGQERADMILTELGKVLTDCMSESVPARSDTQRLRTSVVSSIDHFRFGIMVTTSGQENDLGHLQQMLLERLARPIQIEGQTVSLSSCQGVAIYPHDADGVDKLLQRADNAMRDAQSRGGGFKYYCAETDAAAARKLNIEHMLHEALDQDQLTLAFQPISDVKSGRVTAAEALLRWRQSDGSYISPAEFVPIAEDCGLMNRIGEFVLEQACVQLKEWHKAGIHLPQICVNVAKVQLMSGDFVPTVKRVLSKYEIDPGSLELELSERGVLSGEFEVVEQLKDSAIAYLRELPVDTLKIDRSYVSELTENDKDAALVSAMIALGQRLNLKVVAEGVERLETLTALRAMHCDAFQGFLISKPVPCDAFISLLRKTGPGRD
jgi:diguanylate cyclase (GGDEF)-like protein